jgi:hypothetical protein
MLISGLAREIFSKTRQPDRFSMQEVDAEVVDEMVTRTQGQVVLHPGQKIIEKTFN